MHSGKGKCRLTRANVFLPQGLLSIVSNLLGFNAWESSNASQRQSTHIIYSDTFVSAANQQHHGVPDSQHRAKQIGELQVGAKVSSPLRRVVVLSRSCWSFDSISPSCRGIGMEKR